MKGDGVRICDDSGINSLDMRCFGSAEQAGSQEEVASSKEGH